MEIKQTILNAISDMAADFLYYDRKEDEDLNVAQLKKAVADGIITIDEMVAEFKKSLDSTFNS